MLKVTNASVSYGASRAVKSVSVDVDAGEIVAVLGSNGAGKSSFGQGIAGLVGMSTEAKVEFGEQDLSTCTAEQRVKEGIVYVPEGRRVFGNMSVEDNLRVGSFVKRRNGDWQTRLEEIFERLPRLEDRRRLSAGFLSGGEQQLLAIGRALMPRPSLLILDEPSLGLAPKAITEVAGFLKDLCAREEIGVLILEQNISFASKLAQRGLVLHLGEVVSDLSQVDLADPEQVRGSMVD